MPCHCKRLSWCNLLALHHAHHLSCISAHLHFCISSRKPGLGDLAGGIGRKYYVTSSQKVHKMEKEPLWVRPTLKASGRKECKDENESPRWPAAVIVAGRVSRDSFPWHLSTLDGPRVSLCWRLTTWNSKFVKDGQHPRVVASWLRNTAPRKQIPAWMMTAASRTGPNERFPHIEPAQTERFLEGQPWRGNTTWEVEKARWDRTLDVADSHCSSNRRPSSPIAFAAAGNCC